MTFCSIFMFVDDESELLYLIKKRPNGRWIMEDIDIHTIRLDILEFSLTAPLDK